MNRIWHIMFFVLGFIACNTSSKIGKKICVQDIKEEPALSLINFYRFYLDKNDSINYFQERMTFPNGYLNPNVDTSIHVRVDFNYTEKYLNKLENSGYVSKELINFLRREYKKDDSLFILYPEKPDVPPSGFSGDYFFGQMGPEAIKELMTDTLLINEIKNDTGIVKLKNYGGVNYLIKQNNKWQIIPYKV